MENKIVSDYIKRIKGYIDEINIKDIVKASKIIMDTINSGKKIFIIGNGGSMATAMHFAEDLLLGNKLKGKVFHLSNVSAITAVSNDFSYEDVFVKQLEKLMDDGDLLITISCSGLSNNLIKAIEYANKKGYTLSISGFHGGYTKRNADFHIFVRTEVGDYETTEDIQLMICHMIARLIKEMSK